MDTRKAYDTWASQYDTNKNRTRDLEAQALRSALTGHSFDECLEIGCGTGKNTEWLVEIAKHVTAVDLSEEMLARAREKNISTRIHFQQSDINKDWTFVDRLYDLVTFSLVLEHIERLEPIFTKLSQSMKPGGIVYIGELHPFKQYLGTKARFDTDGGQQIVECFNHHISDFIQPAKKHGLSLVDMDEHFDDAPNDIPRIFTMILKKG